MRRFRPLLQRVCACTLTALFVYVPSITLAGERHAAVTPSSWQPTEMFFIARSRDGQTVTDVATPDETARLAASSTELHVIQRPRKTRAGLTITLRSTAQLDANPAAKAAFMRAAAFWEDAINTEISIVIDVDYGAQFFGGGFPNEASSAWNLQLITGAGLWTTARNNLVARASDDNERAFYELFPADKCPTDLGDTTNVRAPAAVARALGLAQPVQNPALEQAFYGDPAKIGYNSANASDWDFDRTDGIDATKLDFEGLVAQRIGAILGFASLVGTQDDSTPTTRTISVLDAFRFAPGITRDTFTTAPRLLKKGGDHVFFLGGASLALDNGDNGDAGYWLDDDISGHTLGLMEPTPLRGHQIPVGFNDYAAFDRLGYTVNYPPINTGQSTLESLTGSLSGNTLTLEGEGTWNGGRDLVLVATYLDASDQVVGNVEQVSVTLGAEGVSTPFEVQLGGIVDLPTAFKVRAHLTDANGSSEETIVDFSQADAGGSTVTTATFKSAKNKLKITGAGLSGTLQLEVNGVVVAPPARIKGKPTGTKATATGTPSALGLQSGPNRIRIVKDGLHSNIFVLER